MNEMDSERDRESSDDEEVDPRVKGELEGLNNASEEINILETELERARTKFRSLLADSTQRLNSLHKKLGKCVIKARPYYDLQKESKKAQAEAQKAALSFQRANGVYQAAKETVFLAEQKLESCGNDRRAFDSAWQEMLNHATMKFMESETEKTKSEAEHSKRAADYADIQLKLRFYEKDIPRMITRSKAYFDLKAKLEQFLQMERLNVDDLQRGLLCAKLKYRAALTNLEQISEEIHMQRKMRLLLPPRTPGVGAESDGPSEGGDLPSINLDILSETASYASVDDDDVDSASVSSDKVTSGATSPDTVPQAVAAEYTVNNPSSPSRPRPVDRIDMETVNRLCAEVNRFNLQQEREEEKGFLPSPVSRPSTSANFSQVLSVNTDRRKAASVTASPVKAAHHISGSEKSTTVRSTMSAQSAPVKQHSGQSMVTQPLGMPPPTNVPAPHAYLPHAINSSTSHSRPRSRSQSREQHKQKTAMAFPMLQGLTDMHQRMSPKIQRAQRVMPLQYHGYQAPQAGPVPDDPQYHMHDPSYHPPPNKTHIQQNQSVPHESATSPFESNSDLQKVQPKNSPSESYNSICQPVTKQVAKSQPNTSINATQAESQILNSQENIINGLSSSGVNEKLSHGSPRPSPGVRQPTPGSEDPCPVVDRTVPTTIPFNSGSKLKTNDQNLNCDKTEPEPNKEEFFV